jgi:hypothetical protein
VAKFHCRQCVLWVRVHSVFTTGISVGKIILILSSELGIKSTLASEIRLESLKTLSWALMWYLTGWLISDCHDILETVLPELLEYVPLALRQRLWFEHDGPLELYGEDVQELLNAVGQECELDAEGWLLGPLGHQVQLWWISYGKTWGNCHSGHWDHVKACLRFFAMVNWNTKLRKILNEGNLILRLLTWKC